MTLHRLLWLAALAACALLLVAPVLAASAAVDAGAFALLSWTTAPGGSLQGGAFTLDGTAGQSPAGSLSGGAYALNGGVWQRATPMNSLYLAAIRK